ncbi:MAG: NAD(P)-dependent glycerol-3-phosphate dehydrogenase [Gammaproteobacteria bacterium]|nr:NAD(P)-dependent glycerol-3-phosphate dehydrogenase [Gammaproteobacteria bacterium]
MLSPPILIIGAGSWGTALAFHLANNGEPVRLWGHSSSHLHDMHNTRRNTLYFPDTILPPAIEICLDLQSALHTTSDIFLAVPSHAFRETLQKIAPLLHQDVRLAWGTKGLDPHSGKCLDSVASDVLGAAIPLAVLSGPTFAREVLAGQPTAVTIASRNRAFFEDLRKRFQSLSFRVYPSTDLIGVQLAGTIKNILAIAAGVSDGLGYGANTRAALITRGLAEMTRLGLLLGAEKETFMGLAGIGDLILTATDNQSRNRRFGLFIGQGKSADSAAKEVGQVIEGILNSQQVYRLATQHQASMPITTEIYHILYHHRAPHEAVRALLEREPTSE